MMQPKFKSLAIVCAGALGVVVVAPTFADGSTNSRETAIVSRSEGLPSQTAESWNGWMSGYAAKHQGRISREAYMDEMGRRWDYADRNSQGLTPAEVSRIYGNVDSSAGPSLSGSGVQPGNMGPGNSKGQ
jgi:hypothetical protein